MTSHTNIFRYDPLEYLVEVKQKDIDYWCSLCQFPLGDRKCTEQWQIQECWNRTGAIAGAWHKQHECPFIHQGQECRCNNYSNIKKAFVAAHLDYKK